MADMKTQVADIVKAIGGQENVNSATHCVTRLRLQLKDQSKVDTKALDANDLVQGNFLAAGQFQIVIGPQVKKVFNEFVAQTGAKEVDAAQMKAEFVAKQNPLQRLIRLLGSIFIPIIPAIVASGLLMGINNVMGNPGIFFPDKSFIEMYPAWSGLYNIINLIANTSFTFLPALVGWSAVKQFGGNPLLGIVLGLIMVHPDLVNVYSWVQDPEAREFWNVFGLQVSKVAYQGQVIPVIVSAILLTKLQKFFEKVIPDAAQLVLVAPLSLLITGVATFLAIGPITMAGANLITDGVMAVFNAVPVIGGALYGIICPPLVITGMHHLFLGVNVQMAGTLGYCTLWPVGEPVTVAQCAASLAMFFVLRRQDKKMAGVAATSGVSAALGITEPAIYGINLRYKYPFVAVMIAGAFGGAWMGGWGVKTTSVGAGGVLSFLSVFPEQWGIYLAGEGMTILLTMALTIAFGKIAMEKEKKKNAVEEIAVSDQLKDTEMCAYLDGKVIPIEEVNDGVFSEKVLGDGLAIEPSSNVLISPVKGKVCQTMEDSGHAVGIELENGLQILLHVGLDTVDMKGDGFSCMVEEGDAVAVGDPLIRFDRDKIKQAGHRDVTVMVVADEGNAKNIQFHTGVTAKAGQTVILSYENK